MSAKSNASCSLKSLASPARQRSAYSKARTRSSSTQEPDTNTNCQPRICICFGHCHLLLDRSSHNASVTGGIVSTDPRFAMPFTASPFAPSSCTIKTAMPAPLTHPSARVLEFDSLLDLLRGYASSPLGQARIAALAPSTDRAWLESQHQLASEIREFRRVGGRFEFSGLLPTAKLVAKSRILGAI